MNSSAVAASEIPALAHDEAMAVSDVEYRRLLDAVDGLRPDDWTRPTDCTGWDVKAVVSHVLGMVEMWSDQAELARQMAAAGARVQREGGYFIDALTALQVEAHAALSPAELSATLRATTPLALQARTDTPASRRAQTYHADPPYDEDWTFGYLIDVIHLRDVWMHRIDLASATGTDPVITPEHDGRIVADAVAEWARRHGQPFQVTLLGDAGGTFIDGDEGDRYELDAIEFCRILSGRREGTGLLATEVPF